MPKSYVDEIVVRYLMKKGYLISQGIWFPVASGWSDIDIFAVKHNKPPLIIQCKSFSGGKKSEKFVEDLVRWFNNAEEFLKKDPRYKEWSPEGEYVKVFIVDSSIKKTEGTLKDKGIKICHYKDILNMLLEKLENEQEKIKKEKGRDRIGKEEDVLLRVLIDMIGRNMIERKKIEEEKCL